MVKKKLLQQPTTAQLVQSIEAKLDGEVRDLIPKNLRPQAFVNNRMVTKESKSEGPRRLAPAQYSLELLNSLEQLASIVSPTTSAAELKEDIRTAVKVRKHTKNAKRGDIVECLECDAQNAIFARTRILEIPIELVSGEIVHESENLDSLSVAFGTAGVKDNEPQATANTDDDAEGATENDQEAGGAAVDVTIDELPSFLGDLKDKLLPRVLDQNRRRYTKFTSPAFPGPVLLAYSKYDIALKRAFASLEASDADTAAGCLEDAVKARRKTEHAKDRYVRECTVQDALSAMELQRKRLSGMSESLIDIEIELVTGDVIRVPIPLPKGHPGNAAGGAELALEIEAESVDDNGPEEDEDAGQEFESAEEDNDGEGEEVDADEEGAEEDAVEKDDADEDDGEEDEDQEIGSESEENDAGDSEEDDTRSETNSNGDAQNKIKNALQTTCTGVGADSGNQEPGDGVVDDAKNNGGPLIRQKHDEEPVVQVQPPVRAEITDQNDATAMEGIDEHSKEPRTLYVGRDDASQFSLTALASVAPAQGSGTDAQAAISGSVGASSTARRSMPAAVANVGHDCLKSQKSGDDQVEEAMDVDGVSNGEAAAGILDEATAGVNMFDPASAVSDAGRDANSDSGNQHTTDGGNQQYHATTSPLNEDSVEMGEDELADDPLGAMADHRGAIGGAIVNHGEQVEDAADTKCACVPYVEYTEWRRRVKVKPLKFRKAQRIRIQPISGDERLLQLKTQKPRHQFPVYGSMKVMSKTFVSKHGQRLCMVEIEQHQLLVQEDERLAGPADVYVCKTLGKFVLDPQFTSFFDGKTGALYAIQPNRRLGSVSPARQVGQREAYKVEQVIGVKRKECDSPQETSSRTTALRWSRYGWREFVFENPQEEFKHVKIRSKPSAASKRSWPMS
ncbi:hypothetical protein LTR56_002944 [Elasticomyces elasticus]|nr:hypothetical protein LTR22_014667 [Elasticomyces elasticus]KAK3656596.1 hypothetical protein LTR56_002944 [Elasticomyces elasticus]KAK4930729.1 hypothetical protein LTR49_002817 [Elasticomyces elasticus]KAK5755641.1 hypothetical protein LTS12_014300 [Elasticomyces elasticus]